MTQDELAKITQMAIKGDKIVKRAQNDSNMLEMLGEMEPNIRASRIFIRTSHGKDFDTDTPISEKMTAQLLDFLRTLYEQDQADALAELDSISIIGG
jgi:hypothetical protein